MHLFDLFLGMASRPRFFEDGWGDRALCDASEPELLLRRRVRPVEVRLGPAQRIYSGVLRDGTLESPEVKQFLAEIPAGLR